MVGRKTHEQQLRIIEKRENTSNAGDDFKAKEKLSRSKQERQAHSEGATLRDKGVGLPGKDDRAMVKGESQESQHNRRRAED